MAVIEMYDRDDVVDDHQGHGDGESYVVSVDGGGQGDGLGARRPLHCVYLVVLPNPSDARHHLRTDIVLASDELARKSRSVAEPATPPRHSHIKTGMNGDVVAYGEEDEESSFVGILYPADLFLELELRDAGEETTETGTTNRIVVVRYGQEDEESNSVGILYPADVFLELELRDAGEETTGTGTTNRIGEEDNAECTYIVNCVSFVHPDDVFLELPDDSSKTVVHVRFLLSESEVGFGDGDGDTGGEKLGRFRLVSESAEVGFGFGDGDTGGETLGRFRLVSASEVGFDDDDDAREELVLRPPIIAACQHGHGDEEDWVAAPVPPEFSWEHVLGSKMPQLVSDTCALVAATVCLEAQHRLRFEEKHGRGTFPCRAASPRKLRAACLRDVHLDLDSATGKLRKTWAPRQGAYMDRMLTKLKQIGGARTTNAPPPAPFYLPLADWTCYRRHEELLTHQTVARLIFERGPCVGCLFSIAGCRREDREMLIKKDPRRFGMHALVCYAYRHTKGGKKLKIQVLDNHWPSGGTRWVDLEEFDEFYVLYVYPLPPRHLLGRSPPLVYPLSGVVRVA